MTSCSCRSSTCRRTVELVAIGVCLVNSRSSVRVCTADRERHCRFFFIIGSCMTLSGIPTGVACCATVAWWSASCFWLDGLAWSEGMRSPDPLPEPLTDRVLLQGGASSLTMRHYLPGSLLRCVLSIHEACVLESRFAVLWSPLLRCSPNSSRMPCLQ